MIKSSKVGARPRFAAVLRLVDVALVLDAASVVTIVVTWAKIVVPGMVDPSIVLPGALVSKEDETLTVFTTTEFCTVAVVKEGTTTNDVISDPGMVEAGMVTGCIVVP